MSGNKQIDPRFDPPVLIDFDYIQHSENTKIGSPGEAVVTLPPGGIDQLLPPQKITVLSQRVRTGEDGKTLIDLEIEVEDVPGATEYEVRVAG